MSQFAKFVMLQLLRAYKWALSPMFPPACRYLPTCSEYAMEAVERYGALRGSIIGLARILRCHPFAKGGYDPVVRARHFCSEPFCSDSPTANDPVPTTPVSYHGAI